MTRALMLKPILGGLKVDDDIANCNVSYVSKVKQDRVSWGEISSCHLEVFDSATATPTATSVMFLK